MLLDHTRCAILLGGIPLAISSQRQQPEVRQQRLRQLAANPKS